MRYFIFAALLLTALVFPAAAQETADVTPSVTVSDQLVIDSVTIENVDSQTQGWIVIHIDNGGSPGPVAGFAPVNPGSNPGVVVDVETTMLTPVLFAMLHVDDGAVGEYEFDGQSGLDAPVAVDGQVVTPAFNIAAMDVQGQTASDNTVLLDAVTIPVNGWVVIHVDFNGAPGPVIGQTQVTAGTTTDVSVALASEASATLWPMLHVDDGEAGVYEFDGQSGLDAPLTIGGSVAVTPISTTVSLNASPQILIPGDGAEVAQDQLFFQVDSVLVDRPSFVVIHADADGAPGPVLGNTYVGPGTTEELGILLTGDITPVVWPMLHTDTGEIGVYEFDGQNGLDQPTLIDGSVVTFPVPIAPLLNVSDQELTDGTVVIDQAMIDAPGWLVIHASANGAPGPVLGHTALTEGLNENVSVTVDAAAAGNQVFPMLHYDTGEAGVYEFDGQNGLDLPVSVGGSVVVVPLGLGGGEVAAPAAVCSVSPAGAQGVNIRAEASTSSSIQGTLTGAQDADGQTVIGAFTWYHLAAGGWVRGDVVTATGDCAALPMMESAVGGGTDAVAPAETGGGETDAVAPAEPSEGGTDAVAPAETPEV